MQEDAPRDVVDRWGRGISAMIANADAVRSRSDSNGAMMFAPDRGIRTSDRNSDPCQDIAQDMLNLDDEKASERAEERYEESCEGH